MFDKFISKFKKAIGMSDITERVGENRRVKTVLLPINIGIKKDFTSEEIIISNVENNIDDVDISMVHEVEPKLNETIENMSNDKLDEISALCNTNKGIEKNVEIEPIDTPTEELSTTEIIEDSIPLVVKDSIKIPEFELPKKDKNTYSYGDDEQNILGAVAVNPNRELDRDF